ncbi:unconventional myosin-XIX isoform X2 [Brachyhypopomus gauderio]|uniref:unconventional myosin-XIX isoform X2 n=1 Tax=Brachyhypopomus gauderio TaxID=698409 RepID=UPI004040FCEE
MANVKSEHICSYSSEGNIETCAKSMNFQKGGGTRHQGKVNGVGEQGQTCRQSFCDSLGGDVGAFLVDEDELHTYDDLTKVNPVTPTTVLKCLQARYGARVFYTRAGCTLVALNPFQPVPHLYSLDVMHEYHCAAQPQDYKPHIFIVAEEAYRNVRGQAEPINQSLVVSGESGAGKTWTSRCLMKYYATVAASSHRSRLLPRVTPPATSPISSHKSQNTVERIERRVLDSNPVMEAFGNACTLRNSNSSRFGKYIQLQLNSSQQLVGASVQTYLLEKTRVAFQAPNERNFHIFYQMLRGATEEQRQQWGMQHHQKFTWLPNAEKTLEEDRFQETVDAMASLGLDTDQQAEIFQVMAGILHLGEVSFRPAAAESERCELNEESEGSLQKAAALLRVPASDLEARLSVRTLRAGRQGVLLKPCSQDECGVRRDCLAKVIYAHLFEWLVAFINSSMCANDSSWCNFIGLLDVYGFECFLVNSLEQLCINYANEKLQQHFVTHYLRAQQDEYVAEGLHWSFIRYQDNQGCLDLIEGSPASIFSLLNEECRLNRPSDAEQFCVRLQKELSDSGHMSWDKFSKQPHFIVTHYASPVTYRVHGMMEKNKDPVPPELLGLLQQSEDPLLRSLFAGSGDVGHGPRGPNKVPTVVSKFKSSLDSLMKILLSTTPHYTRCIKPNPDCRPLAFREEEVMTQLEACGIVETIHISAAGFPIRIPYGSFIQRYGLITTTQLPAQISPEDDRVSHAVQDIVNTVLKTSAADTTTNNNNNNNNNNNSTSSSMVHCGKTKVFLTHPMLALLEAQRDNVRSHKAFCVQCCWRRYRQQQRIIKTQCATRIQAAVRAWLVRREVRRWHRAASVIQTRWRFWRSCLDALAEAELDNAEDLQEEEEVLPPLARVLREGGSVQLPSVAEPVALCAWPLGLAVASAPHLTLTFTATGFQRLACVMATLKIPFRPGEYKVETNQFNQGVASIRAQPQVSVKLHMRRSPLLYADMYPGHNHGVTGFNQILLEKT